MVKFVLWITVFMLFSCQDKPQVNKRFHPKQIELVQNMPATDKFWIFMLAGQSNMEGRGEVMPQDTLVNRHILTINQDNLWIYAKEPIHFNLPELTGLGSARSFAENLLNYLPEDISIGLIPCAVGGTSIEQWLYDSIAYDIELLSNFSNRLNKAKKYGTIKGILWHHGEHNARPDRIDGYSYKLEQLIMKFRSIAENDSLPIIAGELGSFSPSSSIQAYYDSINSMINRFADLEKNVSVVETPDLTSNDDIHFDSKSQRELGKRFAFEFFDNYYDK